MGAEVGAIVLDASLLSRESGREELVAAETSLNNWSWGVKILASTSLSNVKCRTSSLGSAVIESAKCVIAGKMSIG